MQRPFPAYSGDRPYVFVSYAHADAREVYREIRVLHDAGFNIWYDEGISPGSRWTDDLADRISNAALVLFFLSPNSVASENCRNEVDFAIEQQRRLLVVHLRRTELPGGMKLALSGRQALLRYEFAAPAYRAKLIETVSGLVGAGERKPASKSPRRRLSWIVAGVMVLLTTALAGFWFAPWKDPATAPVVRSNPLPLLIADFHNQTEEALFDGVLEEALKVAMEGAPFITSYPRDDAQRMLADLSEHNSLDLEAARLIAVRQGLELVLAGEIRGGGTSFEIDVLGVEPLTGEQRLVAGATANSPLDVLKAVAGLAEDLRRDLGDVPDQKTHLAEIFTSSSLEAVAEFARGQALAANWKHAEAVEHYARAVELDPDFGRAYGGWAYSSYVLGNQERSGQLWEQSLALLNTMSERERLRTLGVYYMTMSRNVQKAIESYETLTNRFPADAAGHNNLAVAYFSNGQLAEARETGRKLLEIYPNSLLYLGNLSLFNMYLANMEEAKRYAEQTLELDPQYHMAYLPLAMDALLNLDFAGAERIYAAMSDAGPQASVLADVGRADVALTRGDYGRAVDILTKGLAAAEESGNAFMANLQRFWLARARLALGDREAAGALIEQPSGSLRDRNLLERAELDVALGRNARAVAAAQELGQRVSDTSRAYGRIITAWVALADGDPLGAIEAAKQAIGFRDHWLARQTLGIAYFQAGYHVEAMDELDLAWQRRGEGLAVFLDDVPSYWRLVELHYWRGRAQEALNMAAAAADSYARFLALRDHAPRDAKIEDAAERLRMLDPSDAHGHAEPESALGAKG